MRFCCAKTWPGDVLLRLWHMDADILNEVGNILGPETGLSPNFSVQAAYNIVYTSLHPPSATPSFLQDSVSYTREGNCRLIQLGRDGSSVDGTRETAGRNMVKITCDGEQSHAQCRDEPQHE
jgi:hypothetical protein